MEMTKEQRNLYRSLSNDPNERGRLWKEYVRKNKIGLIGEVGDYYEKRFLERIKQYDLLDHVR